MYVPINGNSVATVKKNYGTLKIKFMYVYVCPIVAGQVEAAKVSSTYVCNLVFDKKNRHRVINRCCISSAASYKICMYVE